MSLTFSEFLRVFNDVQAGKSVILSGDVNPTPNYRLRELVMKGEAQFLAAARRADFTLASPALTLTDFVEIYREEMRVNPTKHLALVKAIEDFTLSLT